MDKCALFVFLGEEKRKKKVLVWSRGAVLAAKRFVWSRGVILAVEKERAVFMLLSFISEGK